MTGDCTRGLDLRALDRHLRDVGIPRDGELRAELISGSRSNLTFLVYDDASKWVLRRPPLHCLTPSAHDMAGNTGWSPRWRIPRSRWHAPAVPCATMTRSRCAVPDG